MQTRFWIASYADYDIAQREKEKLQNDNPDRLYQIRRGQDKKGGLVFRIVERLKIREVKALQDIRGKKKKGKKKNEDLSWIRG